MQYEHKLSRVPVHAQILDGADKKCPCVYYGDVSAKVMGWDITLRRGDNKDTGVPLLHIGKALRWYGEALQAAWLLLLCWAECADRCVMCADKNTKIYITVRTPCGGWAGLSEAVLQAAALSVLCS